jgi:hypothetical protein
MLCSPKIVERVGMYKILALFVLILAPILVMLAENLTPSISEHKSQDAIAPAVAASPVMDHEAPAPVENPITASDSSAASPVEGSTIFGQPTMDPKGIDPSPQWSPPASIGETESPASEASSETMADGQA